MTNLPSRAMEAEAMELPRTTFACPSWWVSDVWDEESANRTSASVLITWTVLVPLHNRIALRPG
jgi:hypothetical protein